MVSIPKGKCNARVIGHRIERASTGTESVVVGLENDAGRRIEWRGALTERGLSYTVPALQRMGWRPEEHDWDPSVLDGSTLLVGAVVEIDVVEETYNGQTRTKVKWINRARKAPAAARNPVDAAAAKEQLRAKVREVAGRMDERGRPAPRDATPPTSPSEPMPDDEIPF